MLESREENAFYRFAIFKKIHNPAVPSEIYNDLATFPKMMHSMSDV